jgi:pyruvate/2-oxoglutarate dehydrogenase complex dihydrolipoamide acyltransferase (E2) component
MPWYVSRQNYSSLGEDALVVEITGAAKLEHDAYEYANPGQLVAKYAEEGTEHSDPREAVKAAIEVAEAWKKDGGKDITIRYGCTWGSTIAFDEPENADDMGAAEVKKWADDLYEELPKCTVCGEIMGKENWYPNHAFKDDSFVCCSEQCAEKASEPDPEDEQDDDADDENECDIIGQDGKPIAVDLPNRAAAEEYIAIKVQQGQYNDGELTIREND